MFRSVFGCGASFKFKLPGEHSLSFGIEPDGTPYDGLETEDDKASSAESRSQETSVSSSTSSSGTATQWLVFASSDPAAILDARGDSIQWDYVDTQQKVALALMSESIQEEIAQKDHSLVSRLNVDSAIVFE